MRASKATQYLIDALVGQFAFDEDEVEVNLDGSVEVDWALAAFRADNPTLRAHWLDGWLDEVGEAVEELREWVQDEPAAARATILISVGGDDWPVVRIWPAPIPSDEV